MQSLQTNRCSIAATVGTGKQAQANKVRHEERTYGRSPTMELTQFQARWCHREVLCRAASDRVLELRWTATHPVPLPTEGIG